MTSPYESVSKENFDKVKAILEWGIEKQQTPDSIARMIADRTNINIIFARALVQEELIGAMEFMKDGNKVTD